MPFVQISSKEESSWKSPKKIAVKMTPRNTLCCEANEFINEIAACTKILEP